MKISKRNFIDYFLLLFAIAVSGIPYFSTTVLFVPLFIILYLVFLFRKREFDKRFLLLLVFVFILTILQTYTFNFFSFQTSLGVFLRIIIAYLLVKVVDKLFIPYYIKILYYTSLVSLIIYIPILLIPSFGTELISLASFFSFLNIAETEQISIVLYNLTHFETLRNSGPFWEPGAFAGYLMLAYIFNFFSNLMNKKKIGAVLLITILTTMSTTAYLAVFTFLFFAYYIKFKNIFVRSFAVIIIIVSGYYSFVRFDFLGEKIEYQLSFIDEDPYLDNTNTQRFLNILRDVEDFKGHEIIGRGSNPITRYSYELENQIRTVGLTDILVRMGLPFFILMMLLIYSSLKQLNLFYRRKKAYLIFGAFLSILILLMSEVYFNFPIFWSLLFLQFVYKKPIVKKIYIGNRANAKTNSSTTHLSQQAG